MIMSLDQRLLLVLAMAVIAMPLVSSHDYGDALTKSFLFYEGQRSGKLPPNQRMTWRKDSALTDGFHVGVDLVGGYYDAGDNIKFNFPMAFSITMLAWSVVEFGQQMGPDLQPAMDAIKWGTDYFLKATNQGGFVYVQVGNPNNDHLCWERPEDMDTPRITYAVSRKFPGSEVSAEIAAALAASSMVFRNKKPQYSTKLLNRARTVFQFADKYRGSYNETLGPYVCPFYCDFSGYHDDLLWGAAWLFRATQNSSYWDYVLKNIENLGGSFGEFGWDNKHAGINTLVSRLIMKKPPIVGLFVANTEKFVCSVLPESPSVSVKYSPGGLLFKSGGSNLQHTIALSFLILVHSLSLREAKQLINCGNVVVTPDRLVQFVKSQVDYILGSNPMKMSYMVGYGTKFPKRIHHRASSLPSVSQMSVRINCADGSSYVNTGDPNPNLLTGAVVGGPDIEDSYADDRVNFAQSEPTTYINAPLVGLLAYLKACN